MLKTSTTTDPAASIALGLAGRARAHLVLSAIEERWSTLSAEQQTEAEQLLAELGRVIRSGAIRRVRCGRSDCRADGARPIG